MKKILMSSDYYSNTKSKYFRVVDPTTPFYPFVSGFDISINNVNYNTGTSNDIHIGISDSNKSDIIFKTVPSTHCPTSLWKF